MNKHYHFIIWAADKVENGNYTDNVVIDLIDDSVDKALSRASQMMPEKKVIAVRSIIEHFDGACLK